MPSLSLRVGAEREGFWPSAPCEVTEVGYERCLVRCIPQIDYLCMSGGHFLGVNFLELRQHEVRRMPLPRTPVNKEKEEGRGAIPRLGHTRDTRVLCSAIQPWRKASAMATVSVYSWNLATFPSRTVNTWAKSLSHSLPVDFTCRA